MFLPVIIDWLLSVDWHMVGAGAAACLLVVWTFLSRRRTGAVRPAGRDFRVRDAYVIDGDTLAAGDTRLRIWGIDAPEADHPHGPAATEHMKRLVAGRVLTVTPIEVDAYGRLVARIRAGRDDIGAAMVRDGYAMVPNGPRHVYARLERQARKSRSGLWRTGRIDNPEAWRNGRR